MNRYKSLFWKVCFFIMVGVSVKGYSDIQVIAMPKTPEPDNVGMDILYPQNLETEISSPVRMEVRVLNYSLGEDSDFSRKNQVYNSELGQSIHVIIDDKPYFPKITQQIDPFNDDAIYFQRSFEFTLPDNLTPGAHIIRAFLCRSFGESLKTPKAFDSLSFFYKGKKLPLPRDLEKPYLTYNEPSPNVIYDDSKPIFLDFYVNNCNLSSNSYKVKLTIDEKMEKYLNKWTPYYIYGLGKGKHLIQLQLVDKYNKQIPGKFNNVKTQITIN